MKPLNKPKGRVTASFKPAPKPARPSINRWTTEDMKVKTYKF